MKKFSLLVAALLITSCACITKTVQEATTLSTPEIFRITSRSAVLVDVGRGTGSGTVVNKGPGGNLVLTCSHVTDASDGTYKVIDADGIAHYAVLFSRDETKDLALLFLPNTYLPALEVSPGEPDLYDTVYVVASPHGIRNSASMGWISSKKIVINFGPGEVRNGSTTWSVTGPFVFPGVSGGTIVDEKARLVCVPEAGTSLPQITFCVTPTEIREFLKANGLWG